MLQSRIKQLEDLLTGEGKIYSDQVFFSQEYVRSDLRSIRQTRGLDTKRKHVIFRIFLEFFVSLTHVMDCLNVFNFPPKNLEKYERIFRYLFCK